MGKKLKKMTEGNRRGRQPPGILISARRTHCLSE